MQTGMKSVFTVLIGIVLGLSELGAAWSRPQVLNCYQANTLGQLVMDAAVAIITVEGELFAIEHTNILKN